MWWVNGDGPLPLALRTRVAAIAPVHLRAVAHLARAHHLPVELLEVVRPLLPHPLPGLKVRGELLRPLHVQPAPRAVSQVRLEVIQPVPLSLVGEVDDSPGYHAEDEPLRGGGHLRVRGSVDGLVHSFDRLQLDEW